MPVSEKRFREAVGALPALPRAVFLLHAAEDLPYGVISERLMITVSAVQCCLAEALAMIVMMLDGERPQRWRSAPITAAETRLHQRYRHYREARLRAIEPSTAIASEHYDADVIFPTAPHEMRPVMRPVMSYEEWLRALSRCAPSRGWRDAQGAAR